MGKDTTAFRERFNAYKNGKSVSEIYDAGLPRYAGGTPSEFLWHDYAADLLDRFEGFRENVYLDGKNIPTIGYGFTDPKLVGRGKISKHEAKKILKGEISTRGDSLRNILGAERFDKLADDTKAALLSYYYNYPAGFKDSTKMMAAWRNNDYDEFVRLIDAGMNDAANPGLRDRRIEEQNIIRKDPFLFPNQAEERSFINTTVAKFNEENQFKPWLNYHLPGYPLNNPAPSSISSWNNPKSPAYTPAGLQTRRIDFGKMMMDMLEDDWEPPIIQPLKTVAPPDSKVSTFTGFKNGKLPRYKDGTRYLWDDQTQSWDRITDSDVANAMAEWAFTPTTTRAKFDYENTPNPVKPIQKNAVISQDNNAWTKQRVAEESNKRTWLSDAADVSHTIGEGAMLASTFAAPEIEPLVYPTYQAAKTAITTALTSNTPAMLYLRYPVGKIVYGLDAQFPTLYRKIKALPTKPENGMVLISNPANRFMFSNTKEESPIITNFTYDAPVRAHANGNWDSGYTLAIPGRKALLGKNVISTEPSDLFTYGDDVRVPLKDIKLISGDIDEINEANKYGYDVITSPKLLDLYKLGDSEGVAFETGVGRFRLRKQELSEYAKEVENVTRQLFRSPTKKDVDFMNFVLLPKIKGQVYNPNQLGYLLKNEIEPFGDRIGNAQLRRYLFDPDRWKNILYDPATHAEANFRDDLGIVLKRGFKNGKIPTFKNGKSSIHINPANRGKFNATKKRTGKTTEELAHSKNPLTRKRAIFALNSRKWSH